MKIFAFHLLNDYSGSPKVLKQLTKGWINNDLDVHLITSNGREGFLTDIEGLTNHYFWYKWAANPYLRLINLLLSQIHLIIVSFSKLTKNDIIYINTILPFGAAFLGKIIGCRIIYHLHETTMKPPILKSLLFGIAKWAANDIIYVSHFLSKQEKFSKSKTHILYNAIEDSFLEKAIKNRTQNPSPSKVLMVCSLKDYKGVKEFVLLAKNNSLYQFRLVLNASKQEIDLYFAKTILPANIKIFNVQTNLHPFYNWADIILNLSRPDGWVETFGLTIIEGMAYGLPAIVPPVGGITELVEENSNGFLVDSRDNNLLNKKLNTILSNPNIYYHMSINSIKKINTFREGVFVGQSLKIIDSKQK